MHCRLRLPLQDLCLQIFGTFLNSNYRLFNLQKFSSNEYPLLIQTVHKLRFTVMFCEQRQGHNKCSRIRFLKWFRVALLTTPQIKLIMFLNMKRILNEIICKKWRVLYENDGIFFSKTHTTGTQNTRLIFTTVI